jgi:hypothetical protein
LTSSFLHTPRSAARIFQRSCTNGSGPTFCRVPGDRYPRLRSLPYQTIIIASQYQPGLYCAARRTDVVAACWRGFYAVRAAFDAVPECKLIIIFADHFAAVAFDGFNGALGRS